MHIFHFNLTASIGENIHSCEHGNSKNLNAWQNIMQLQTHTNDESAASAISVSRFPYLTLR